MKACVRKRSVATAACVPINEQVVQAPTMRRKAVFQLPIARPRTSIDLESISETFDNKSLVHGFQFIYRKVNVFTYENLRLEASSSRNNETLLLGISHAASISYLMSYPFSQNEEDTIAS